MTQTTTTTEIQYNVWELGPWSRLVDCRTNKADADYIATLLTLRGRQTHIVTIEGSQFDRNLRKESRYSK